mmetsp:Transcript_99052/g.264775  ORF Transcript_99052/g.264775 Transcript_99052/m.264775 type:complete len:402 (-) Transcript_99052:88-1293(-)
MWGVAVAYYAVAQPQMLDFSGAGPDGSQIEIQFEPINGPPQSFFGGTREHGADPSFEAKSATSVDDFSKLFMPGPVVQGPGGPAVGDTMITNLLSHMNDVFHEDVIKQLQQQDPAQHPCHGDIQRLCREQQQALANFQAQLQKNGFVPGGLNPQASPLHCLGQHAAEISEQCRERVKHAVPFVCGAEIDRWCDGIDKGLLPCLQDHINELQGRCLDSVHATEHIIHKVNNQKVTLVDKGTGETKAVVAPAGWLCPRGFSGGQDDTGCCMARPSLDCDQTCTLRSCETANAVFKFSNGNGHCCPPVGTTVSHQRLSARDGRSTLSFVVILWVVIMVVVGAMWQAGWFDHAIVHKATQGAQQAARKAQHAMASGASGKQDELGSVADGGKSNAAFAEGAYGTL